MALIDLERARARLRTEQRKETAGQSHRVADARLKVRQLEREEAERGPDRKAAIDALFTRVAR